MSLVLVAAQDRARGLRKGMERREVVVKVVSGGQNSLRGQIGLERVLRWKSRFRAWMRFGTSGQAKLEQERRDMQHKYRLGRRPLGTTGG